MCVRFGDDERSNFRDSATSVSFKRKTSALGLPIPPLIGFTLIEIEMVVDLANSIDGSRFHI